MAAKHGSPSGTANKKVKLLLADPDVRVEHCERYLSGLHTALWGQAYDLFDEGRRHLAAEWLSDEIGKVLES